MALNSTMWWRWNMDLCNQLRLQKIKRWNIVETARNQTVAEHTYNVIVIARALAEELGWGGSYMAMVIQCALEHDMQEGIEGDIPTPTKRKWKMHEPENVAFPFDIRELVKMADTMEAFWFISQYAIDRHGRDIINKLSCTLRRMVEGMEGERRDAYNVVFRNMMDGRYEGV